MNAVYWLAVMALALAFVKGADVFARRRWPKFAATGCYTRLVLMGGYTVLYFGPVAAVRVWNGQHEILTAEHCAGWLAIAAAICFGSRQQEEPREKQE